MPDLFSDYVNGSERLMPFYARPARAVLSPHHPCGEMDAALVAAVNTYQERLGGRGDLRGDELVVVTGQQPGLFTGPLYTVCKAATAILLAEKLERATGRRCVPLFWVAADDHDFEEVRDAHFLARTHERVTLRYTPGEHAAGPPGETAMMHVPLTPQVHQFIDRAAKCCPCSELTDRVCEQLHASADEATSLSDWFARLLAQLFRGTALRVFTPELPEARRAAVQVLHTEISRPLASTHLLNETGRELEALGYAAQVVKGEKQCNFFLEVDGCRRRVLFHDGHFHLPEARARFSSDEMLALLDTAPGRFSANVALRCVVQQALFPATAAYVAGPGELAYWAQLKPLFAHFGQPMPVVYPRARAVILTEKLKQLLERFDLTPAALLGPRDALVEYAAERTVSSPAVTRLAQERNRIEADLAQLTQELTELAPDNRNAQKMASRIEAHLARGFDRLERQLRRGEKEHFEAAARQVERLCTALAPDRKPQERVYCAYSWVFAEGDQFIAKLLAQLDIQSFELNEVCI